MILNLFSSQGWQSWAIEHPPLIPERMPVLIDDDLRFEDGPAAPRPTTVVNRWLRELPASGAPAASSWESYARVLKAWMEFLAGHGVGLFDSRSQLKHALGKYAEHRATGPTAQPMSEPRPYPDSPLSTTRSPACAERPTAPLPFADSLPALPKSGHAAERTAATPSPEEKMMTSLTCPAEKRNTHRRADSERGPQPHTASAERRHAFAHLWLDQGGAEGDLMERAGWTSPQMLTRYGASARSARARRSYDRIELGDQL